MMMVVSCRLLLQADEHPSLLWSFVDAWHARSEVDPRDCWTDLVSTAAQLITPQLSKVHRLLSDCLILDHVVTRTWMPNKSHDMWSTICI